MHPSRHALGGVARRQLSPDCRTSPPAPPPTHGRRAPSRSDCSGDQVAEFCDGSPVGLPAAGPIWSTSATVSPARYRGQTGTPTPTGRPRRMSLTISMPGPTSLPMTAAPPTKSSTLTGVVIRTSAAICTIFMGISPKASSPSSATRTVLSATGQGEPFCSGRPAIPLATATTGLPHRRSLKDSANLGHEQLATALTPLPYRPAARQAAAEVPPRWYGLAQCRRLLGVDPLVEDRLAPPGSVAAVHANRPACRPPSRTPRCAPADGTRSRLDRQPSRKAFCAITKTRLVTR